MTTDPDALLAEYRKAGKVPNLGKPSTWNPALSLRDYQGVGAAYLITKKKFVLGDPTGSGKTPMTLYSWARVRDARIKQGKQLKLWVVTTKSAVTQWAEEVEKFLIGVKAYPVPEGKPFPKRLDVVKAWIDDFDSPVLVQNWRQFANDWQKLVNTGS